MINFSGKKVLVTGHSGFKGSWLCLLLKHLGAEVLGYSDKIPTNPSHFQFFESEIRTVWGDIRDAKKLSAVVLEFKPDFIFHLAAQSLVRYSYDFPVETFEVNVQGTVNILNSVLALDKKVCVINVTTDKCYENKGYLHPYKETDQLGGKDPYSSSKACSELVTQSYRDSLFTNRPIFVATARAGNVIGGGDWSLDRIIPDIARTIVSGKELSIRYPDAIRPWQHVLDVTWGYIQLMSRLHQFETKYTQAFNFGPTNDQKIPVIEIVKKFNEKEKFKYLINKENNNKEMLYLILDSSKSIDLLNWSPMFDTMDAIDKTICWYQEYIENKRCITNEQIINFMRMR